MYGSFFYAPHDILRDHIGRAKSPDFVYNLNWA